MNCQDIEKRLEDYLRHELGSKERQFFELHVMSCAVCNEAVKRARILHRELQNLTSIAVPKDFVLKVHRRVESLHQPRWAFQPWRWPAGVLASLIIGVFVFKWILPYHPIPGKPSEKITMLQERDVQHVHVEEGRGEKLVKEKAPDGESTQKAARPSELFLTESGTSPTQPRLQKILGPESPSVSPSRSRRPTKAGRSLETEARYSLPKSDVPAPLDRLDFSLAPVSSPERTQVSSFEESRSKQTGAGSQASEKMDQNSRFLEGAEVRPSSSNFFPKEQEELIPVVAPSFSSVRKTSEKDKVSSVEQPLRGELKSYFAAPPEYDKGDRSAKMIQENLSSGLVPSGDDEPLVNVGSARLERWLWRPKEKKITFLEEYLSDQRAVWTRDQNGVYHVQIIESQAAAFLNWLKDRGSLASGEDQKMQDHASSDHPEISMLIELTVRS